MSAVVVSGLASSEHDGGGASFDDAPSSSSTSTSDQAIDSPGLNTLTREEAFELGRFSEGKARIDEHLELLQSKPSIDAFADFKPSWESMTLSDIEGLWEALDAHKTQVSEWIDERDGIEETTLKFDTADMERLRKLAKACSQRNMSREDTDIVEVALETLVALEGLRVALSLRERRLSLLDARLAWETARRECCALYRPLANDVDAFVAQQARWKTPSQRQQPASTYSDLTSHSEGLLNRIAFFSNVVVPQSSAALDEVIEQCQAPEVFLDEQDRLEDLAVALTSRAGFVQDLLSQWKAAEDLHHHVQALSTGSQSFLALVADVKSRRPTRADAATIASNSTALRRDLVNLCQDDQAEKFLSSLERAAARLQFCPIKHALLLPRHDEHWPEQAQIDDDILAALRAQLTEAATAARQAIEAAKAFAAAFDALEKASELQVKVQESTKRCQEIAATARSGWMADDEGLGWDTIVTELLQPTRPPQQGLKKAETIPALQSSFRGVEKETQAWCSNISDLHLTCQSLGLTPAAFQPEADDITAAWREASQAAKSALDDAMSLRQALRLLDDLFRAQDTAGPALEQLRTCLLADIDALAVSADEMADEVDTHSVPRNSDRDADMAAIEAQVSGHSAAFEVVQRDALLAKASETLSTLATLHTDGRNNLEDCKVLHRWSQALSSQRLSVSEQHSRFAQLDRAGSELRHAFSSNAEDQQLDFDALEERLDAFAKDVDNFKESQHTSLKLLGDPPTLHTPSTPPLNSPDALVRDASHSWCLKLDSLRDEVKQLLADARERARTLKEQEEREAAERERLRLEEEEKQAAEERERLRLEEEERQAAIERERQAMLEAEAKAKAHAEAEAAAKAQAEAEAKAAEEAAKEAQAAQERAQVEAERVAKEEEKRARAKAEAEAEEARARAEREAREEEERRRAAEEKARLRAAEEGEARRQAAEEEARLKAAQEEAQAKIDEEELAARVAAAPEQVYEVLEQVRQEAESCDSAVASRDRGFKKVLGSANSRRLPQRAFISELCNRRKAAEDTLTARRDALDATMQSMTELLALLPSTPEYDDVRREAERAQRKVHADSHALLEAFDDAIRAEGGDPLASYSNSGSVESSPIGTSSAPRRRLDSLKGGIRSPPVSPVSPASPAFPAQPLPDDVRQLIEDLKRSLQPGEVELQTILDGKKQARMLIELPTLADAERVDGEANDIRQNFDELLASYPKEAILGLLVDLVQARATRVERYKQLAAFNKDFIAMERALGDFLNLLDEVDGSRLDRLTPSPHPGSRPSSRLTRTPVQDVTQTLQTRLAALDPLIETAEKAAKPVAQDVRVRDRLEQLRKSYVDMAEMARDVLNPEAQRSLSAMSHATSDGSLSTASTPLPGTPRFDQYLDDDDDSSSVMATPTKIPRPRASAIEGRAGERPRTASLTMRSSTTDSRLPRLRPPSTPQRHGPPHGRHSSAGPATPVSRSLGPRRGLPSIAQSPVSTPPRPTGASRTVDSTPTSRPRTTSMKQPAPPLPSSVSRSRLPTSRPSTTSAPSSSRPRASTSAATVPRFGSNLGSSGTPSSTRPNRYRANPKSRLDIAVAKVINRMPMPVSMVHASQMPRGRGSGNGGSRSVSSSTDSAASVRREEWKDDSGRYWVGHPDPKLCFCRILRSRTIMVRIGGGWQELTRYLIQHYGLSVPPSVAATGGDAGGDGSIDAAAATNPGLASSISSSSSIQRFAGEAGSSTSALPWLSSATLRDQHTRIPSTSSTTSIASSIARGNRRTASAASSVGSAATRSGGISSPILFNADGSPQDYFGMSPRTPTGAGSRQAARQRTTSLEGQGGSPTSRTAAAGGRASPTPPPPVPPLPLVLDVSPATQRRRDGASTSPLTAFTVQQREGRESAGRASAHAFQLKAPPTPAPAPNPRGGVSAGTTSPPPPSSWRSPKHASSAIRSPPMATRMGLPSDSSPSKPGAGGDGLPASESGSDLLPLFFRKQEPSSPEDHRRAGAATPSSGRKSAAAIRTRKVSGPAGGRSGTAGGGGAKSPT